MARSSQIPVQLLNGSMMLVNGPIWLKNLHVHKREATSSFKKTINTTTWHFYANCLVLNVLLVPHVV